MSRRIQVVLLVSIFLLCQFGALPSYAAESEQNQDTVSQKISGHKKKRILPLLIWAGSAILVFDQIKGNSDRSFDLLQNGNQIFTSHDLKNIDRMTDTQLNISSYIRKHNFSDDLAVKLRPALEPQFQVQALSNGFNLKWSGEYLIGRLDPVFISLKQLDGGKIGLLVAGLDKLAYGEFACIELNNNGQLYRMELSKKDCDKFGVYRTSVNCDVDKIDVSMDVLR